MTKEDMKTKRQLQPVIQQARDENKKFRFITGKLNIESKLYNRKFDHPKKTQLLLWMRYQAEEESNIGEARPKSLNPAHILSVSSDRQEVNTDDQQAI